LLPSLSFVLRLPAAFAGVYGAFSHSDFSAGGTNPSKQHHPRVYVAKSGFMRQVMDDLRPVEEFCSVYRPLLHWHKGVTNRFLGEEVDLGAPGSPPSMACYWMCFPASSSICLGRIYGNGFNPALVPLVVVEQVRWILVQAGVGFNERYNLNAYAAQYTHVGF